MKGCHRHEYNIKTDLKQSVTSHEADSSGTKSSQTTG